MGNEMEEERHVEQVDRKRIRSSSTSSRCDIRSISSFGSEDQSASAIGGFSFFFFIPFC